MTNATSRFSASLPDDVARGAAAIRADWLATDKVARVWRGDGSLWTGGDEGRWLGWLRLPDAQLAGAARFSTLAAEARAEGVTHVLVLGMGGSSLCPEVLRTSFAGRSGAPELLVCDSTDPAQVASFAARVPIATTLFVVSSKSGGTLEPNIFQAYFFDRAVQALGAAKAGRRFIAITDPGSAMEKVAAANGFRRTFHGLPSVGGRFSALSDFGLVPAALVGIDAKRLVETAVELAAACGPASAADRNPGVELGSILGGAARVGRDKITFLTSASLPRLGAWLEQLLAESTGKQGRGVIPVDGETLAAPSAYGADRVFVRLEVDGEADAALDARLLALAKAGHPVVRIRLRDAYDLGAEFYRWEFATAVLGEVLRVHPFDQPDVEASKIETKKLTTAYEEAGRLPGEAPILEQDGLKVFADPRNAAAVSAAVGSARTLESILTAHFGRFRAGDYGAFLAYLPMTPAFEASLRTLQNRLRDAKHAAVCLGFGPRFLHSTGQAYKGGPNSGVFLQLTCDDAADLPVPGKRYTFGVVKAAQARGDLAVLVERGRRVLRIHLPSDVSRGLDRLARAVEAALR